MVMWRWLLEVGISYVPLLGLAVLFRGIGLHRRCQLVFNYFAAWCGVSSSTFWWLLPLRMYLATLLRFYYSAIFCIVQAVARAYPCLCSVCPGTVDFVWLHFGIWLLGTLLVRKVAKYRRSNRQYFSFGLDVVAAYFSFITKSSGGDCSTTCGLAFDSVCFTIDALLANRRKSRCHSYVPKFSASATKHE